MSEDWSKLGGTDFHVLYCLYVSTLYLELFFIFMRWIKCIRHGSVSDILCVCPVSSSKHVHVYCFKFFLIFHYISLIYQLYIQCFYPSFIIILWNIQLLLNVFSLEPTCLNLHSLMLFPPLHYLFLQWYRLFWQSLLLYSSSAFTTPHPQFVVSQIFFFQLTSLGS